MKIRIGMESLIFKMYVSYKTRVNKGISINKDYNVPTRGYMVGLKTYSSLKEMLKEELTNNCYYGTWIDEKTNKTYYDISINVLDYKEAVKLALKNKELAIYDINNNTSIYI